MSAPRHIAARTVERQLKRECARYRWGGRYGLKPMRRVDLDTGTEHCYVVEELPVRFTDFTPGVAHVLPFEVVIADVNTTYPFAKIRQAAKRPGARNSSTCAAGMLLSQAYDLAEAERIKADSDHELAEEMRRYLAHRVQVGAGS